MSQKKKSEPEADGRFWEVKRDGEVLAYGPKETMPDAAMRKDMRLGGLKVYVEGKLYREGK